jgi:8-oxo-dGTP pyrophosphatase MutT (NUDIX family)
MSPDVQAAAPKESATVILLRKNDAGPGEVFLARRHRHQSFMAGAYVFPGGQVDHADAGLSDCIQVPGHFNPPALLQDTSLTSVEAQSLFCCAIRETFEETGVLLAETADGHCFRPDSPEDTERLATYRRSLNAGSLTLREIAIKEHLFFSLNALIPYAHWITPEISPKRFSTYFFLAELPHGQTATTDADELTDFLWVTPGDALQMHIHKEIMLMPPTLKTLEELSAFTGIDELFDHARRRSIYPILPQAAANILKLPHDPEYSIEEYKKPVRPAEPCRLIFTDGIWRTGYCDKK